MIAVIGDIHGCLKSLDALINNVFRKYDISKFIVLGDFVDRGKNSLGVTKFLMRLSQEYRVTLLRGNHEDMLIDYVRGQNRYPNYSWHERIGLSAITSFSDGKINDMFDMSRSDIYCYFAPYMPFFESSIIYTEEVVGSTKFFFSHAGIERNGIPIEEQYRYCTPSEVAIYHPFIWGRQIVKFENQFSDYTVVHGHIPLFNKKGGNKKPSIRKDKKGSIISVNLDTGCVYGGALTAMLIDHTGQYEFESVKCMD